MLENGRATDGMDDFLHKNFALSRPAMMASLETLLDVLCFSLKLISIHSAYNSGKALDKMLATNSDSRAQNAALRKAEEKLLVFLSDKLGFVFDCRCAACRTLASVGAALTMVWCAPTQC